MGKKRKVNFNYNFNPKKIKKSIRLKNPDIFKFSKNDSFIYESKNARNYINKNKTINILKPNNNDSQFLAKFIKSNQRTENTKTMYVLDWFDLLMKNVKKISPIPDERAIKIREIIQNWNNNSNISVKRVTEEYNNYALKNNKKIIHKSLVHKIITKTLNFHYRKTAVKTNKVLSNDSIVSLCYFIKIVIRALTLKLNFIFIDECGFFVKNSNFRTWRKANQKIYYPIKNAKKINLLMGVSDTKIFHFKLNVFNTDSKAFRDFMQELINLMTEQEKQDHIFLMDNCSCHLTSEMFKFYSDNKLKILFNIPYYSNFNMIENVFRLIKNLTYKKLYETSEILKNDIKEIIKNKIGADSLGKLYNSTLIEYKNYLDNHLSIDLNNL